MKIHCFCGRTLGEMTTGDGVSIRLRPTHDRRLEPHLREALERGEHVTPAWDDVNSIVVLMKRLWGEDVPVTVDDEIVMVCSRHGTIPVACVELERALRSGRRSWKVPRAGRKPMFLARRTQL